jgi:hypothetical protein
MPLYSYSNSKVSSRTAQKHLPTQCSPIIDEASPLFYAEGLSDGGFHSGELLASDLHENENPTAQKHFPTQFTHIIDGAESLFDGGFDWGELFGSDLHENENFDGGFDSRELLVSDLHEYQDTKTDNDKSSVILGVILPTNYGDDVMCKMLHNNNNQFHPDMIEAAWLIVRTPEDKLSDYNKATYKQLKLHTKIELENLVMSDDILDHEHNHCKVPRLKAICDSGFDGNIGMRFTIAGLKDKDMCVALHYA